MYRISCILIPMCLVVVNLVIDFTILEGSRPEVRNCVLLSGKTLLQRSGGISTEIHLIVMKK